MRLAILSPDVGDGKTYVAANTAVAFSQLGGGGTLLIDADLRSPRQQELFGIEPERVRLEQHSFRPCGNAA